VILAVKEVVTYTLLQINKVKLRYAQAGAWQQYDNNDESRLREGVGGFVVLADFRLGLVRTAKQNKVRWKDV
jgi:hypothetical protein